MNVEYWIRSTPMCAHIYEQIILKWSLKNAKKTQTATKEDTFSGVLTIN